MQIQQKMTIQQALDILSQIAAAHVGTLQDHNLAQSALKALRDALETSQTSAQK